MQFYHSLIIIREQALLFMWKSLYTYDTSDLLALNFVLKSASVVCCNGRNKRRGHVIKMVSTCRLMLTRSGCHMPSIPQIGDRLIFLANFECVTDK